jgi:putative redox protein
MANVDVALDWLGHGLAFEGGAEGGPTVNLDGDGGAGPTPVQTALLSLAACMAADVLDILRKMRLVPTAMAVRARGDRKPEPPRRYTRVELVFRVAGLGKTEEPKVERAIQLSREKYCSVLHTWRPGIELETRVVLA